MLLGKVKLDTVEVLIFNALIDWFISYDEFFSVKSWNLCVIHYANMADICRKMYERNGIETIVDSDGIF